MAGLAAGLAACELFLDGELCLVLFLDVELLLEELESLELLDRVELVELEELLGSRVVSGGERS